MGWYRVVLHCALPPDFRIDGEAVAGFYTPRFVEASFDKAAADVAISQLHGEPKFRDLRSELSADPVITAEDVEPVEPPAPDGTLAGFIFYPVHEHPGDAA